MGVYKAEEVIAKAKETVERKNKRNRYYQR